MSIFTLIDESLALRGKTPTCDDGLSRKNRRIWLALNGLQSFILRRLSFKMMDDVLTDYSLENTLTSYALLQVVGFYFSSTALLSNIHLLNLRDIIILMVLFSCPLYRFKQAHCGINTNSECLNNP